VKRIIKLCHNWKNKSQLCQKWKTTNYDRPAPQIIVMQVSINGVAWLRMQI